MGEGENEKDGDGKDDKNDDGDGDGDGDDGSGNSIRLQKENRAGEFKVRGEMMVMPNSLSTVKNVTGNEDNIEILKKRHSEDLDKKDEKKQKRVKEARRKRRKALEKASIYFKLSPLPVEISEEQLCGFFEKCGVLDVTSEGKKRLKLYRDADGKLKGDGVATYVHAAAVDNAVLILSDREVTSGVSVEVSRAEFDKIDGGSGKRAKEQDQGGNTLMKKSGAGETMRVRMKLGWDEDGEGIVGGGIKLTKIVILKNVFDKDDTANGDEGEDEVYGRIKEDMEEGCGEIGKVELVTVFKKNKEGAVAIKFRRAADALKCVERMNGRWYDRRQLKAEIWDGVTDYRWKESEMDKKERLKRWENWLEQGDEGTEGQKEKPRD